nr:MAG: hypothetical protein CSA81_13540 [Acidobacteriota bacterium]
MDRAVELLCELSGGVAEPCGIDLFPGKHPVNTQQLRISRTARLLGVELDQERIVKLLESIGFRCQIKDEDTLNVEAPSFRVDIEREADLIEEVARLYGYDNISTSLPQAALSYPEQDSSRLKRFDVNAMMLAIGYTEAINYSFTDESYTDSLGLDSDDERRNFVRLLNPLSKEQGVLRTTLLPGLLENVKRNLSFQKTSVRLFEIGKVFRPLGADSLPQETMFLGGILCGNKHGESSPLYFPAEPVDIFDAKGVVEYLLEELRIHNIPDNDVVFVQPVDEGLENFVDPDYALLVFVGEHFLGSIGKIDAEVLRNFGIKCDVYYFELDFDQLCELQGASRQFASLPVFPAVKRDVALVVPDAVSAGELLKTVRTSREKLVESAEIFDVFQGGNIKKGFKSVAVSITYRSANKTLTEKNVEKVHNKIVKLLTDTYGGSFRDA